MKFNNSLTEKKKRNLLRGSGETAKQKQDWKKMEGKWPNEETSSSLRELKTGKLVLTDKF